MTSSMTELEADVGHPRRRTVLAVLAAVAFMAQLDLFIVNIAIPAMGDSFDDAGLSSLSWVLNGYAIVFATLLVPAGRFADHFGRRRFLLAGIALFTAGSILCAVAPTVPALVLGRVVQAIGAAAIVPASLGLLYPVFPARRHGMVVGVWAGVAAVAATAGPVVGGVLVTLDWRWIFAVNVPIGVVCLLVGRRVVPEVRSRAEGDLPRPASVLALLVAVGALVTATVEQSERGWDLLVVSLAGVAVLALALTVADTLTRSRPLLERNLFASREFSRANAALLLFFVSFAAWLLLAVLFLQNVWGYSALRAGFAFAPGPISAAAFALSAGAIAARVGRRLPATVGPLFIAAAGIWWLVAADHEPNYLIGFLPGQILGGIGSGLTQAPLLASASTLPAERATTGSAVLSMSRQIGSAVGVALLVAVMATQHPVALPTFRRGWLLVTIAAVLATLVQLVGVRSRKPAASAVSAR